MIAAISTRVALEATARSLYVPTPIDGSGWTSLAAQSLRRSAEFMAPCGRGELERAVTAALRDLGLGGDHVAETVEKAAEDLLVYGDLFELRDGGPDRASFMVHPAPSYFVSRPNAPFVILGVGSDDVTPLVQSLSAEIVHHGVLRLLPRAEGVRERLRELSFPELSLEAWLRLPWAEKALEYVSKWASKMDGLNRCGDIEGLRVISPGSNVRFYKGRWAEPKGYSGDVVARRPQRYGADPWCLVRLEQGRPTRLLDIVSEGDRLRACDVAWRIQMAMDAVRGAPQSFRSVTEGPHGFLEFFSPLPSWAERRLSVSGERADRSNCLLGYRVPPADLADLERFLRDHLWLVPRTG